MEYYLNLNSRPFEAIKNGTKKVEGRAPKDENDTRYHDMVTGDIIIFTNNETQEKISCKVLFVNQYKDVRTMLETENIKEVLSSGGNIEEGIESYHSLSDYKERVDKYGIYAIGIVAV